MTSEETAQNFQNNRENTEEIRSIEDENCECDKKLAVMLQNEEDYLDYFERQFESTFPTGYKISNVDKVFLNIKKNQKLVTDKLDFLDEESKQIIYQFFRMGILESVNKVVHTGKKSIILQGYCHKTYKEKPLPSECAIKIHRNGNQQKAEKEMQNLIKLSNAKISCPEFVILKKHIIVMSFINDGYNNDKPARKLKDTTDDKFNIWRFPMGFYDLTRDLKAMFEKAELIPVNMSEKNLLYRQGRCYFIDVRNVVTPSHKNAFDFLMKVCQNIIRFYLEEKHVNPRRIQPRTAEGLFKYITGYNYDDKKELLQFQDDFKKKRYLELCKTLKDDQKSQKRIDSIR